MAQPTQTFGPWLKQKLVEAGEISPDAQGVNLDPKVRDAYLKMWQNESKGGGNFQPAIVPVTNPITQEVSPAFMSSANSATLMRDSQPRTQYKPDKDGNLLAIEGTSAAYVTNTTGERIKVDPKSNAMADMLAAMGGMGNQAPVEEDPGFFSRIFGGVSSSPATNAPTATPTPMPSPTPAAAARTNAPAPVAAATPAVFSAAQYKQMTGQDLAPGDYQDANGRPFSVR